MKNLLYVLLLAGAVGAPKVSYAMNSPFGGFPSVDEGKPTTTLLGRSSALPGEGKDLGEKALIMRIKAPQIGGELQPLDDKLNSHQLHQFLLLFQYKGPPGTKKAILFMNKAFKNYIDIFRHINIAESGKITTLKFENQKLGPTETTSLFNIKGIKALEFNNSSLDSDAYIPEDCPLEKLYISGSCTRNFLNERLGSFMNIRVLKIDVKEGLPIIMSSPIVLPYLKHLAVKDTATRTVMNIVTQLASTLNDVTQKFPSLQKLEVRGEGAEAFLFSWTSGRGSLAESKSTAVFEGFKTFSHLSNQAKNLKENGQSLTKWIDKLNGGKVIFLACDFSDEVFGKEAGGKLSQCCSFRPFQEQPSYEDQVELLQVVGKKSSAELKENPNLLFIKKEKVKKLEELGEEEFEAENVDVRYLFCPKSVDERLKDVGSLREIGEFNYTVS